MTRSNALLYDMEIQDQNNTQEILKNDSPANIPDHPEPASSPPLQRRLRSATRPTSSTMMLLGLIALSVTSATRCPESFDNNYITSILNATDCVPSGIVIAETNSHGLCWYPTTCPTGVIRSINQKTRNVECGPACPCPSWATDCSHSRIKFHGPLSDEIKAALKKETTLATKDIVCSWSPTRECSSTTSTGFFHQIETTDGSIHIVDQLNLRTSDYSPSQYYCFSPGSKEPTISPPPPFTGTSKFCTAHQCKDSSTTLCTFGHPTTFITLSDGTTTLTVQAWGTIHKTYYPLHEEHRKESLQPPRVTCTIGGATVTTDREAVITACISKLCQYKSLSKSSDFRFTNEFVMHDYEVIVTASTTDGSTSTDTVHCPASPFCEAIDCTFCAIKMWNTHCWTVYDIILFTGSFLLFTMLTWALHILEKILRVTGALLHCVGAIVIPFVKLWTLLIINIGRGLIAPFRWTRSRCRRQTVTSRTGDSTLPLHQLRAQKKRNRRLGLNNIITIALIVALQFQETGGCTETTILTASSTNCIDQQCKFNEASRIILQPLGHEACLTMRSPNHTLGYISIRMQALHLVCHKRTLFFTRSHTIKTASSHRCAGAGSCDGAKCGAISYSSRINEFSSKVNSAPGYSFCEDSCGCAGCDGCFYCSSSCLYYRVYAKATKKTIHEVFHCPSYSLESIVDIAIHHSNHTITKTTMTLIPGVTREWKNIDITLITTTMPASPILGSTFINNGGMLTSTITGQNYLGPSPHSVAQLFCRDRQSAEKMDCKFAVETCSCTPSSLRATCHCPDGDVNTYYQDRLPIVSQNILLQQDSDGRIIAQSSSGSSVELQVSVNDLQLAATSSRDSCTVVQKDVVGCYNCITGAKAEIQCKSHTTTLLAHMTCGVGDGLHHHSIQCSPESSTNIVTFHFDTSNINMPCSIKCPGGIIHTELKGSLVFVGYKEVNYKTTHSEDHPGTSESIASHATKFFASVGKVLKGVLELIGNHWDTLLLLGLFILGGIGAIFLGAMAYPYLRLAHPNNIARIPTKRD